MSKGKSRLEELKALVEKNPTNPLCRYGLAMEYFNLGMYKEAVYEIKAYLTLKDDEGAAYRILANSLLQLGMKEEAKEAYRKGIESAMRYGHQDMVEEFEEALASID